MSELIRFRQIIFLFFFVSCHVTFHSAYSQTSELTKKKKISFSRDVAPILVARCQGCHHDTKSAMGFNLTTYSKLRQGGKQSGPDEIIVAGKPDESRLVEVLQASAQPRMPLKLKPLTENEIVLISDWIKQGALDDGPTPNTALVALAPPEKVINRFSMPRANINKKQMIALSDDASRIAVSEEHMIYIYNLNQNGLPEKQIGPVEGQIGPILFSKDSLSVAVAVSRPGIEGFVERWDIKTGQRIYRTKLHSDQILAMKPGNDNKIIATASYDKSIALIEMDSGLLVRRLSEHTDAVYDVAFDPSRTDRLASVSADRTLKIWDLTTGKRLETLSDSNAEQYAVCYSADGKTVFGAGVDRTIRGWDTNSQPIRLVKSALAHESPVNKLINLMNPSANEELISLSEDLTLKRWRSDTLSPLEGSIKLDDWSSSVATSRDKVAFSTFNGLISVFKWGKTPALVWQKNPGSIVAGTPESLKPQLFRNSVLGAPTPRVVIAGQENEIILNAAGIENAYKIHISPPDLKVISSRSSKPNTLTIRLKVPARNHLDSARIKVATHSGITSQQILGILPSAPFEIKPDSPSSELTKAVDSQVIQTSIIKSGQVARFRINAEKGRPFSISTMGKVIGSSLSSLITLKSASGNIMAQFRERNGIDPLFSFTPIESSPIFVEISDTVFSAGNNHFFYLLVDESPVLKGSDQIVIKEGSRSELNLIAESGKTEKIYIDPGLINSTSVQNLTVPRGWLFQSPPKVLNSPFPVNSYRSDLTLSPPLSVSGQFLPGIAENKIQIKAIKNQPLIIETYARRLGRELDTFLEIRDSHGQPVQSAAFRKVTDTLVAFRDHGSRQKGIRLTQWADFQMADYVLIGREITRIFQLPRNPDDDCQFFGDEMRWGYFGTTPEQHSMSQTVTKLEPLTPGAENTIASNLIHRVYYANDDAGSVVGNDSWIYFNPPEDGVYQVVTKENTGLSGPNTTYALVIRTPAPDFELQAIPTDWNFPLNGSKLITVNIRRKDGFNGPVRLKLTGLPEGWQATEGLIESDQISCDILITPNFKTSTRFFENLNWRLIASADLPGRQIEHEIAADKSWAVITPESNLSMSASTYQLAIKPGTISRMTLNVNRREPFAGRVPIDVKNLPYGVRVLDIGLNGVLITEPQKEREIRIYAEPWVKAQKRPFYAVGRAESAGTSDSSQPIILEVQPK